MSDGQRIFLRTALAIALLLALVAFLLPPPGQVHAQGGLGTPVYINTATTTAVLPGAGFFDRATINGGTGGVVTLYDIASAGCTGTPASGKFATIASATQPVTLTYGFVVKHGLCVVTAAATDLTAIVN
jgi:hypothetical protein